VSAANVLHKRVPSDHDLGAAVLLHAPHRSQPRLEATVVGLNPVVGVPVGAVPGCWQEATEHHRVGRRPVGHDLAGHDLAGTDGLLEEPARHLAVPSRRDERIDDLPERHFCIWR
jgi:hypothetical protein